VFLLLTGFVNALKPIKQARAGRAEAALSGLASSCFRRTSRLVLPCVVATVFSWILAELGGYKVGAMVESGWLNNTSPLPSGSVLSSLHMLLRAIFNTWAWSKNTFDQNQWTMLWFLKGSLVLYVTLLATVRVKSKYRMMIFVGLFLYSWKASDSMSSLNWRATEILLMFLTAMVGLPIYGGAFLAELSMEPVVIKFSTSRSIVNQLLPYSIILLGWYFMSYPNHHPEWQPWSNTLWHLGLMIFPDGAEVYSVWNVVGVFLVTFGIILSSTLQRVLSHPHLLWLGAQSFPIYLIHGPLLRSFFNWLLYAFTTPIKYGDQDEAGNITRIFKRFPLPSPLKFFLLLPIFYAVLLLLAHVWTKKVESKCGAVTKWLEDTMCGVRDERFCSEVSRQGDGSDRGRSDMTEDASVNMPLLPT
jgi:peptidoglycan/LPS O-acetylase OafA/YrhL